MCTLFVIRERMRNFPLLLLANRDESMERPWRGPAVIGTAPQILAPTDGQEGGTWIGVNHLGLVVAITNRFPGTQQMDRRSRGLLVQDTLANTSASAATTNVTKLLDQQSYNGFNLLLADRHDLHLLVHVDGASTQATLSPGVHAITSSHGLNPPVLDDLRMLLDETAQRPDAAPENFEATARSVLSDHNDRGPIYRVCKHGDAYGTRSATMIALPDTGPTRFSFAPGRPCEVGFNTQIFPEHPA